MRLAIIILSLALVAVGIDSFAIPLTVTTNKHNLSSASSNTVRASTDTRICVFCHTPHGASAQSALWNRKDPSTASFPLYSSGTLNIADEAIVLVSQYTNADSSTYPNGATRMCLSCHDGVSAIGEVLNGLEDATSKISMTSNTLLAAYPTSFNLAGAKVVVDLSTSHPVSFAYNSTVMNYLNSTTGGGLNGRTDYTLPSVVPLDNMERMQCTTCHDPHDDTRSGSYDLPFWRNYSGNETADYDSTCTDCHDSSSIDWGGSWGGSPTPLPAPPH